MKLRLMLFAVPLLLSACGETPRPTQPEAVSLATGRVAKITGSTYYYVTWTAANAGAGTASGTISLPGGHNVGVNFRVLNPNGSPGSFYFGETGCGTSWWTANNSAPYVSASVLNGPPGCGIIALSGGSSSRYEITFSEPIKDPIMPVLSLGSSGTPAWYDFDRQFDVVSSGYGYWGGGPFEARAGQRLYGAEGHGTVRFIGSFSVFSWTVPSREVWHGFTLGIRTTAALEPAGSDFDGDGVLDASDNCPMTANASQADTDGDGIGDACDTVNGLVVDSDGDGLTDTQERILGTDPHNVDTDGDTHNDGVDGFPLDPTRWVALPPTTTTVTFGNGPFVYTGLPFTATATVSPAGTATITYAGDCINVGSTCSAIASYAGDATHAASYATTSITIAPAPTTTTVSFGDGPFVYTGLPYSATSHVSTGGTATIVYGGDCTNAGTSCTATATYAGDANHLGSSGNTSITITKAPSATTVSFGGGPFVYTGLPYNATSHVSPGGTATIVYGGDCTNAGTSCTATATYAGDENHLGSSGNAAITITKAPSTTTVTFGGGPFPYTGSAYTATASVSPGGVAAIFYTGDCINGGISCTATANYPGDPNHFGSQAAASITITYTVCAAKSEDDDDHGDKGSKASKGVESGSTIPVKLRVCNAAGKNISARSLQVRAVGLSPSGSLNDSGKANPGNLFRLDDGTYMFNLSTKGLGAGSYTLDYMIGGDPTVYHYAFIIRAGETKGSDDKSKDGKKS